MKAVGLTSDAWTSKPQRSAFLSATEHFIDAEFYLQSLTIGCKHAPGSHTAEDLAQLLQDMLNDANILDKVV